MRGKHSKGYLHIPDKDKRMNKEYLIDTTNELRELSGKLIHSGDYDAAHLTDNASDIIESIVLLNPAFITSSHDKGSNNEVS